MYQLFNGDCLEIMPTLPAQSVDAIITDLPYGTTACAWDIVIPFDAMWKAVKHVLKPNGAFVTTASQPFTSLLVCSNLAWFRCEWIWRKNRSSNFLQAEYQPRKIHESVLIFALKASKYNPQLEKMCMDTIKRRLRKDNAPIRIQGTNQVLHKTGNSYGKSDSFPLSIQEFDLDQNNQYSKKAFHPTQKPVDLYAYLIRTYTNPGDTVLDMCFGSNTTGVACVETGRKYIGIEKDLKYFKVGQRRIEQAQPPLFVETGTPANNCINPTTNSGRENLLFN
jgi:site-specific DNA-methyltransferase (adenine-specific)